MSKQLSALYVFLLFLGVGCIPSSGDSGASEDGTGFFALDQVDGHWWFIKPNGDPFFSLGLNHIDPASMRYPENIHIWEEKYQGSTTEWLKKSVRVNMLDWGFNTMGWEQEVTVMEWQHSRPFTHEELKALDLPYCRMLPFTEAHQWEKHTVHYDFFSEEWAEWCDYVARSYCAELKNDPNLIGYFFSDCPTWIHTRALNAWRGPMFNPEELATQAGKDSLSRMATQYYKTIHEAIRKYDPNHLILGDRYEANEPMAYEVVEAALPYVDVLSFQDFSDPAGHMKMWYEKTGKPVLLADGSGIIHEGDIKRADGAWYKAQIAQLYENPGCVGFHLCGAYVRNKARRKGLLDAFEQPDQENLALIRATNQEIHKQVAERFMLE